MTIVTRVGPRALLRTPPGWLFHLTAAGRCSGHPPPHSPLCAALSRSPSTRAGRTRLPPARPLAQLAGGAQPLGSSWAGTSLQPLETAGVLPYFPFIHLHFLGASLETTHLVTRLICGCCKNGINSLPSSKLPTHLSQPLFHMFKTHRLWCAAIVFTTSSINIKICIVGLGLVALLV